MGLKIEVVNEGTVRIDCSDAAKSYNQTEIHMKAEIYLAQKEAAEKVRQVFIGASQSEQTTEPPATDLEGGMKLTTASPLASPQSA